MRPVIEIASPYSFNPLKHHLGHIRSFALAYRVRRGDIVDPGVLEEIARIGTSVTDIYTGSLTVPGIVEQVADTLASAGIAGEEDYAGWAGKGRGDFKTVRLSDSSLWVLKYLAGEDGYIHLFPARGSLLSAREKGNSLKSAILLAVHSFDSGCTLQEVNLARKLAGLSPVRSAEYVTAINRILDLIC